MAAADSQVAPGTLEIVRTFLNTWWIPNDTREPTDDLMSLEAMHQFYTAWFGKVGGECEIAIVTELVQRLRSDLRNIVGQSDGLIISQWLALQPIEVRLSQDEEGMPRPYYRPAASVTCQLCAEVLALVVDAITRSTWMRLKACPDCHWVFYDHTKNRNKVWCLMNASGPQGRSCGSISKVRSFRQRQKANAVKTSDNLERI